MIPGPFRVRCLLCGTVAESWHRDSPAPDDATIGMASCACGNVHADAMGFVGYGRVLCPEPQDEPYLLPPYQILDHSA